MGGRGEGATSTSPSSPRPVCRRGLPGPCRPQRVRRLEGGLEDGLVQGRDGRERELRAWYGRVERAVGESSRVE